MAYRVLEGKVHIHDLQATMLHLLGIDYKFVGEQKVKNRHFKCAKRK